ncbi:hypothetical protein GCM10009416_32640 [Craurococcus roseus]|uniref:histidine kinase n=1 Tax=Craurococcus roseus TaxID=77585 RepID=A0ABP3QPM6_9PROT
MPKHPQRPPPGGDEGGAALTAPDRLAALRRTGLLDSAPEPAFDRLTRLACRLLKVRTALVSLVDADRQFFKSQQGLPEPWASSRETPLSHSFCRHVVEDGAPLAVADALAHPRARGNAAVAEMDVAAYLGAPLRAPDGRVLGAFCVTDGAPRAWSEDDISLVQDLAEMAAAAVAARHEVAERRRAEAALRESEERLRLAVEGAGMATWDVALATGKATWTANHFAMLGYRRRPDGCATYGMWMDRLHADDRARVSEAADRCARDGEPYGIEYRVVRADNGEERWLSAFGRRVEQADGPHFIGVLFDVTERRAAEAALARHRAELERLVEERTAALLRSMEERRRAEESARQAERLAALGQLTGGVAHDFNNILQVVASGAALLKRPAVPEDRRAAILEGMIQAGQNARELTGRLLAFARRQPLKPETFDVAERLAGMSALLRQTLGPSVAVTTDITPGLWPVHADPSQLEVAVLNLAVNARDAMPGGGTLTVQARNVALSASAERAAGEYVCIAAKDTGEGVPPHLLARIFEPFFTTKGAGKGTGLGLSQVHGFVTQSGGDIHVESEPGRGTAVFFHLPRAGTADAAGPPAARPVEAGGAPEAEGLSVLQGVGRTVLVVEDNPDVAAFACSLLEDLGYATERAGSAAEALAVLAGGARVDAVFSDVLMPGGISGVELAAALRLSHPRVAVVLATGYSEPLAQGSAPAGVQTLRKPYRLDELAVALGRAIARSAAPLEAAG